MINHEKSSHDFIQKYINYLQEKEIEMQDVHELRRKQLEQIIQFGHFQINVDQILNWIRNGESMLKGSFYIPTSLQTAENLKADHEQFQEAIEVRLINLIILVLFIINIIYIIENSLSCHISAPKSGFSYSIKS